MKAILNKIKGALKGISVEGYVSIIVAIVIGYYSTKVSLFISKQQVDIKGFDSLLSNSNRTIDTLKMELQVLRHQLALNEAAQLEANKNASLSDEANMNEFSSAILRMGDRIMTRKEALKWDNSTTYWWTMYMKEIMQGQLANTYLLKSDTLNTLWVRAYSLMYFYNQNPKGSFNKKDFNSDFDFQNQERRINEINPKAAEDFMSCWNATNKAYEAGLKYLKNDKRFLRYR